MELLRSFFIIAVVSLFVVDVRAKLINDDCEGIIIGFIPIPVNNCVLHSSLLCSMYRVLEQVCGENERARGIHE